MSNQKWLSSAWIFRVCFGTCAGHSHRCVLEPWFKEKQPKLDPNLATACNQSLMVLESSRIHKGMSRWGSFVLLHTPRQLHQAAVGSPGTGGDKQKILTVSDCAISLRNKGVQKNQRLDRRETFMLSLNWYVDTGGTYLWLIRNHLHEAARQLRWLEKQLQLANTFEVRLQEGSRGISALSTFLNYFPIKRWDVLVSELLPHMTP